MKIALYHGYELSGSGSNEYTRYLARSWAQLGHEVTVICSEPDPESFEFLDRAIAYDSKANPRELFRRDTDLTGRVWLHQLPRTSVFPVFLTDKQRAGNVKAFPDLSDRELSEYHEAMVNVVSRVLADESPEVLHVNHLVYQPVVAARACSELAIPFYIVPHGSSIEYTVKRDRRFEKLARTGLEASDAIVWISREVRDRVYELFLDIQPDLHRKSHLVGVGTDTSLFEPLAPDQRGAAIEELKGLHRPGGKSPQQKKELTSALNNGRIGATRDYWDAYDHKLEDDDLPSILDRIPLSADLVLFVGALIYGKGIQTLIAAMPGILARRSDTHLLLVGSGTYREVLEGLVFSLATDNQSLLDSLVSRGRDLERDDTTGPMEDLLSYLRSPVNRQLLFEHGPKLANRVHFIGRLDHSRLRFLFPCCRLAVFPSIIKEASPLVFAEALANGVLPIGSYHSGLRDGLDDLKSYLPDPIWNHMKIAEDPSQRVQSLIEDVSCLLEVPASNDLGAKLREIAVQRYDWKTVAQEMIEIAQSLRTR